MENKFFIENLKNEVNPSFIDNNIEDIYYIYYLWVMDSENYSFFYNIKTKFFLENIKNEVNLPFIDNNIEDIYYGVG